MYLIAATDALNVVWYIAQVAIALGAVIFVHELGHFLVAKACGVKCEKFYVGFDVPIKLGPFRLPAALWRKQWGETEYGIGILPLGGYVKMLGQDDNPGRISEENQRAVVGEGEAGKEIVGPGGETYFVHPRSYLAKSVPQRMAIISAGVVMNVIFAFLFAVVAFGVGVPTIPSIVGETIPGSPAWVEALAPGDEIVAISGKENPTFDDLRSNVTLGDLQRGVPMLVDKAGEDGPPKTVVLTPTRGRHQGLATIGIVPTFSLRLADELPVFPFSPAAQATLVEEGAGVSGDLPSAGRETSGEESRAGFQKGDEIIRINGQDVEDYRQFVMLLARHMDEALLVTVRRGGKKNPENPYAPRTGGDELTFRVEPRPLKRLGLVMTVGRVAAVQEGSPAAEAGLREGDFIQKIDDEQVDPFALPYQLRRRAIAAQQGHGLRSVSIRRSPREGENKTEPTLSVPLRVPDWIESSPGRDAPLACPPLGIAYYVLNRVDRVVPGSPAERAGIRSGDQIVAAEILVGKDDERKFEKVELNEERHNWPLLMETIQGLSPQTKLKLTIHRGDKTVHAEVSPYVPRTSDGEPEFHHVLRGFNLETMRRIRVADSFGEQVTMGLEKTVDSLLLVYRFLKNLITTQVPVTALGGPITIAKATYYSAFEGLGQLLIFLTILSANLAVINFLPIPLLDGGHMVFLIYEGLRRRPPNERFVVALHTIGFVFIISLMLFVIVLDLGLIKRNL